MEKLKVLILGDGLLGSELSRQTDWDVISRKKTDFQLYKVKKLPKDYDVIVNCIANTDTYAEHKQNHWGPNCIFVDELIDHCNKTKTKLVQISSDYIYAGSDENAIEDVTVPVHSKNWYSYTKLLSDGLVQLRANDYLVIRCSQKPKPFPYEKAWDDQYSNTDYVDVIASMIIKTINKKVGGVYNIGTEVKTIYDLAKIDNDVEPINSPDYVPKNITMNVEKYDIMVNRPFFSIAIPTYGYGGKGVEFLEHSLDIILKQTFTDYEVVLSDHSIDDTIKDVYKKYKKNGMNITYYRNENGRGIISPNINNAMKFCNGRWIKVLFQDDYLLNEYALQSQANFLMYRDDIEWAMTTFWHSNDGVNLYRYYEPKWNNHIWDGTNTMGCPSGLTMKNKDLIFFDEGLNWLMDVDYYQRMFNKYGEPFILPEATYVNRTWGARLCDTIQQDLKDKELKMMIERHG